jgi:hypothetical protein
MLTHLGGGGQRLYMHFPISPTFNNADTFITEADGTVILVKRTLPGCICVCIVSG